MTIRGPVLREARRGAAFVHWDQHVIHAQKQLHALVRTVIAEAAAAGAVRADVSLDELADYCLHALSAEGSLPSWQGCGLRGRGVCLWQTAADG